jgi:type II secretory pathway pseudopilin PulG
MNILFMQPKRLKCKCFSPANNQHHISCVEPTAGFSLVEALVASTILVTVVGAAALVWNSTNSMTARNTKTTRMEGLINNDLANLREAADFYTYRSGSYTWNGSTQAGASARTQNYYFPNATSTSAVDAEKFRSDCNSGTMINTLLAAINGTDPSLGLSSDATALGIQRTVVVDDASSHRLRVEYSGSNLSETRRVLIVPTAAAWCP